MSQTTAGDVPSGAAGADAQGHLRFHVGHLHLAGAFGADGFGKRAEAFARFFGTPRFLIAQTCMVTTWIVLNAVGVVGFDLYPFILLNLAFSTQAAYAAPLILLAQTRQADRDKAHADADARHREAIAQASLQRQEIASAQQVQIRELVEQNTALTVETHHLSEQLRRLVGEIHGSVCLAPAPAPAAPTVSLPPAIRRGSRKSPPAV